MGYYVKGSDGRIQRGPPQFFVNDECPLIYWDFSIDVHGLTDAVILLIDGEGNDGRGLPKARRIFIERGSLAQIMKKAEEIEIMLDSAGLDVLEYDTRNQRYRIRFSKDDIQKHERLLKEILGRAYQDINGDISAG